MRRGRHPSPLMVRVTERLLAFIPTDWLCSRCLPIGRSGTCYGSLGPAMLGWLFRFRSLRVWATVRAGS